MYNVKNNYMRGKCKVQNFNLYLDESKPNTGNKYYCLAGYAISDDVYNDILVPELNKIKKEILKTDTPLHLFDMRKSQKGFEILSNNQIRLDFFSEINRLINKLDIYLFGTLIDIDEYKKLYKSHNNVYYILLKILLENYTHFLENKESTGTIYIESRTQTENRELLCEYYKVYLNGTLYIDSKTIQNRIMGMNFIPKIENNIGVQFADLIPGTCVRAANRKSDYCNLYRNLQQKIYNGTTDAPERFGLKKLLD